MKEITDEQILECLLWINDYCMKVDENELGLPINAFDWNDKHNIQLIKIIREFLIN